MNMTVTKNLFKKTITSLCAFGGFMALLISPQLVMGQNYCKPSGNTGCSGGFPFLQAEIESVEFESLSYTNFTGSCPAPGYEDLTGGQQATVTYGNQVSLDVESNSDGLRVWIDWNDDGTFSTDESVASSLAGDISTTIRIPCDVKSGDLRMRVRTNDFDPVDADDACGSFGQFDENMTKDFRVVAKTPPQSKTFQNFSISQVVGRAFPGENFVTNTELKLEFSKDCGPAQLNKVYLSQGNTDNAAQDISDAYLVKGGNLPSPKATYYQNDIIGQVTKNPTGNYVINVNEGINLFTQHLYITHDLTPNAQRGNAVDVSIDSFVLMGTTYKPGVPNPPGAIDILGSKDYCDYNGSRSASYLVGIDSFDLTTIDWAKTQPSQGDQPDWYTFLKDEVAQVERQQTYTAKIASGSINGTRVNGWVDWNNDGQLDGSREEVFSTNEFFGKTSAEIDVPCYADTGFHRLRIGSDFDFSQYIDPCEAEETEGEYEDYRIYVNPTPDPKAQIASADTFFQDAPDSIQSALTPSANWSYEWDLDGDGTFEATGPGALKQYSNSGSKDVMLKVKAEKCSGTFTDTTSKTIEVVKPRRKPAIAFIASRNNIITDQTVKLFNYTRFGATSYKWKVQPSSKGGQPTAEFVNSSDTSVNPTIKFLQKGDYGIFLQATNSNGVSQEVKSSYISVKKENLICTEDQSRAKTGFLFDEGGPDNNYNTGDGTCTFLINPRCADSTKITFRDFLVSNVICNMGATPDNVKVWDGVTKDGVPLHATKGFPQGFTKGNTPAVPFTLTSQSGSFLVQFTAGGCANGAGFKARWDAFQSASPSAKKQIRKNKVMGPDTIYEGEVVKFNSTVNYPRSDVRYIFPNGDVLQSGENTTEVTRKVASEKGMKQVKAITSICGFSDTVSKTVRILPVKNKPTVDFTASARQVGVGDTVQLKDRSFNGVFGWNWGIGTGSQSGAFSFVKGTNNNSQNPYIVFSESGTYRTELVATNNVGNEIGVELDFFEVVDYCEPTVTQSANDYAINQFKLSAEGGKMLINNSTTNSGGYISYNRPGVELEAGRSYVATIGRNTNFNDISYVVYADYNKNGTFDPSEKLFSVKNFSGKQYTDTFTVEDQLQGGFNRVRVISGFGSRLPMPCGQNRTGEIEDYKLQILEDQTAPALMLKDSSSLISTACTNLNYTKGATANDIVDGNLDSAVQAFGSVDSTKGGTYQIVYRVSDQAGNTTQKTQTVIIEPDTTKPNVSLNGVDPAQVEVFKGFKDPGVTKSDACGKVQGVQINSNLRNDILGSYTITYTVSDINQNKASVTRTVNVVDTENPVIELNGGDTVTVPVGSGYTDAGFRASDNYYDSIQVSKNGNVDPANIGTYKLTYTAEDVAGNTSSVTRVVKVVDNQGPSFTGVGDGVFVLEVNNTLTYPYNVTDNFFSTAQISLVDRSGSYFKEFPNGKADSLGVFKADFTFEDGSGNQNTSSVAVRVVDQTAPTIQLTNDVVNLPQFKLYEDSLSRTYTVSDNYWADTAITVNRFGNYFTQYVDSGFPKGLYEIRYQAVDKSGNKSNIVTRGVQIGSATGLEDLKDQVSLSVYPNPSDGLLNLEIDLQQTRNLDVSVVNASGKTVERVMSGNATNGGSFNVDLTDQSKGIYQFLIRIDDKMVTKSVSIQ